MKLKTIKHLGLGLAIVASLTTAANAQIVYYTWVPGNAAEDSVVSGSGTLELNGTTFVSLTFTDGADGTWTGFSGSVNILGDSDAVLAGTTVGPNSIGLVYPAGSGSLTGTPVPLTWTVNGSPTVPNEQNVQDTVGLSGDWVPVPEPTTIIAGAMMML